MTLGGNSIGKLSKVCNKCPRLNSVGNYVEEEKDPLISLETMPQCYGAAAVTIIDASGLADLYETMSNCGASASRLSKINNKC